MNVDRKIPSILFLNLGPTCDYSMDNTKRKITLGLPKVIHLVLYILYPTNPQVVPSSLATRQVSSYKVPFKWVLFPELNQS